MTPPPLGTTTSRHGVPIRLSQTQWQHISIQHPEMITQQAEILDTIANPDLIQQGDSGELLAIRYYAVTPLTSKHLVAAYRELDPTDGFVLTAYLTRKPSKRRSIVWSR